MALKPPILAKPSSLSDATAPLFEAVASRHIGAKICFLCGKRLTSKTRSDEHVIPKWVQSRFNLWNQEITLLNGSSFQYRSLTIPCCRTCNGIHLGRIEETVKNAVALGPQAVSKLNRKTLFLWLGKIFYGLLYKEIFLRRDIKKPKSPPIFTKEAIREFNLHHMFLQASRLKMSFKSTQPWSIFVFATQTPDIIEHQFDLRDSLNDMVIAIRLGGVGLIAHLQDGGAHRFALRPLWRKFQAHTLHPQQFIEVTSAFVTWSKLRTRIPKFMTIDNPNGLVVHQLPLAGLSGKPLFEPWNGFLFANVLAFNLQVPLSHVFKPPNQYRGCVFGENGKFMQLDRNSRVDFDSPIE